MASPWVFAQQLLVGGPVLLVYCIGMVACLIYWQRSPRASRFALIGLLILFLAALGTPLIFAVLASTLGSNGIETYFFVANLALGLLRAAGTTLLIAAVFTHRQSAPVRGFDVNPMPPVATLAPSTSVDGSVTSQDRA